jgi:predicted nuclease with TOPRIM domain
VEDRLSRETNQLQNENSVLQGTINELKDKLVTKESELTVLQDSLKLLNDGSDKFQALLDVGHTKAELKLMTIERGILAEKLQGEEDARKLLEGTSQF